MVFIHFLENPSGWATVSLRKLIIQNILIKWEVLLTLIGRLIQF